jgi:phosphoribosylformylglycinamidine cyclo-ligase
LDSDEITENEQDEREHLTYKAAGVDVKKSDEMKRRMWATIRSTYTPQVYEPHPRGFAGMVLLDFPQTVFSHRYNKPLILLSTDGVGTKLKIAFKANVHNTVGIDLVAMNVNDTLVYGAEPIGFVDYFACGKLNPSVVEQVVAGIAEGCRQAGCPLLGGETAELPGFYKEGEYDLAGFVTAVVDKRKLIDGKRIEEGDLALGLLSSGIHSNGYSLARKVFFDTAKWKLDRYVEEFGCTLQEELLKPTIIYVKPVLSVVRAYKQHAVHAMAHITGGSFEAKIPRVIPKGYRVIIRKKSWEVPPVFRVIQKLGNIEESEMYRVFNMGIGYVMFIGARYLRRVQQLLKRKNIKSIVIGEVVHGEHGVEFV